MKNVLLESMTKISFDGYTIRCWRQEDKRPVYPVVHSRTKRDIEEALKGLPELQDPTSSINAHIAEHILQTVDRMNAVEVLTPDGIGVVAYADWL